MHMTKTAPGAPATQKKMSDYAGYILTHLKDLKGKEVLIIGDVGVDEYVMGQVRRISPEAPVPIVEVAQEEVRLGLASNVAQNVASLGGHPRLISVVGEDACADRLRGLLAQAGVSPEHLVVDAGRPTTRKMRVMVDNHHIVRVDYEHRRFLDSKTEDLILNQVRSSIGRAVAVVIQDYAKGVISERLAREIVALAKANGKRVLADPNTKSPLTTYNGVDLLTPNYDESVALTGIGVDELREDPTVLNRIGAKLMATVGSNQMVVTLGKKGMRIFEDGRLVDLPTNAKQVFDVTGAGDTVIAALALAWGSGFSLEQSCALANFAAGVVVGKVGCVPCSVNELIEAVQAVQSEEN
jgi:rfaE bifunctional protein kinase chain/domain